MIRYSSLMPKLIFLDRDGVINEDSPDFIKSPEEWIPIPGSLESIAQLNQAGFEVYVLTNQSGLGRKLYSEEMLLETHKKMDTAWAAKGGKIEKIFYCPHTSKDNCACRKPKPGLIYQLMAELGLTPASLSTIPMIGDSLRDLESAQAAGCQPILVKTGNGEKTLQTLPPSLKGIDVYEDLSAAVFGLLSKKSP